MLTHLNRLLHAQRLAEPVEANPLWPNLAAM